MVASGRQRLLIPQGIRKAGEISLPWKPSRTSLPFLRGGGGGTDGVGSSGGGGDARKSSSLARVLRKRSRKQKILVVLAAHCLVAAAIALFVDDGESFLLSVVPNPVRDVHRVLCRDYLPRPARSLAVRQSPFAPLPGDNKKSGSSSSSRPLFSSDSTFLRRILTCDMAFNNCTVDDPSCTPPLPEEDDYDRYPPQDHPADPNTVLPTGPDNVAYVLPVPECPPHPEIQPTTDQPVDSSTFYDAFAVVKSATCNCTKENLVQTEGGEEVPASNYNYTMYGIVHTDAAVCTGSDGSQYDLVKTLQELGYYVEIFDEAVYAGEVAGTSPYVAQNTDFTDAVALHAYRLTNHPLAFVLDPTVIMLQPIDELYDALIADTTAKAAYSLKPDGLVDTSMLIIKPSLTEFDAIKESFKTTPYDTSTGWGGSGIGAGGGDGAGLAGVLTHYYSANPALEVDRCTYNNGNDPACKTMAIGDVKIARATSDVCGSPWDCTYDNSGWDAETEALCRSILYEWSRKRADFEDNHWDKPNTVSRTGSFQSDVYLGYCDGSGGKTGYKQMTSFETVALPQPTKAPVPTTPPSPYPTVSPVTSAPVPAPHPDDIPYIPIPQYLQVTCPVMDCGPGSYVTGECTCTPLDDPCQACPKGPEGGTRCQNIEGYPLMCIDCTCGFCNYENSPCCDFNGVNNCKSATNDNECLLQNGFFGPFDGTGSACSGVEISYTATPNGCGCQPSQTEPCTYDPNERTMDEQCYICSADDLVVASSSADDCWDCKVCLNNCEGCIATSTTVLAMEDCLASQNMNKKNPNPECREGCASVCGK